MPYGYSRLGTFFLTSHNLAFVMSWEIYPSEVNGVHEYRTRGHIPSDKGQSKLTLTFDRSPGENSLFKDGMI